MVLSIDGKSMIINLISGAGTAYVNQAGLGTISATDPNETDTGLNSNANLGNPAVTIKTVSSEVSNKQVSFSYTLLSTEGTATTFKEFGLSSSHSSKLFNRQVFYNLYHSDTDEINITQIISIK
jgi:hypothetical protein